MDNNESAKYEISLIDLWNIFKKIWYLVAITAIIFGAVVYGYLSYFSVPMYSSHSTFYVYYGGENNTVGTNIGMAQTLVGAYEEFIVDNVVIDEMKAKIPALANASRSRIRSMLTVQSDEEKMIITVSATHSDPQVAYDMLQIVTEYGVMEAERILDKAGQKDSGISFINAAELATAPDSNNKLIKTVLAAAIGAVICYAVFFVRSMFDYRIHSESDLEDRFDYPVISAIPSLSSESRHNS